MYTGALENHPDVVDRMATIRPLLGNAGGTLRQVRDPWRVAEALEQAGLPVPRLARSPAEAAASSPWVQKPLQSAGGAGVRHWQGGDRLPADHLLQEFKRGEPRSAVYLAAGGRAVLLGVTRQLIGAPWAGTGGFRYCGSIGPLRLSPPELDAIAAIGDALAAAFPLTGLLGVDFVAEPGKSGKPRNHTFWPIEVNPRYTASIEILERSTGQPLVAWHVEACRRQELPKHVRCEPYRACGKVIVFARARSIAGDWLGSTSGDSAPLVADVPAAGSVLEPGWPVVTLLRSGGTLDQVEERLQADAAAFLESLSAE
jgi:predicted ATP-grasp superfamily ATP-dependent carboligase